MNATIPHVLESVIVGVTTVVSAIASALLLAQTHDEVAKTIELQLLLLPLIGALVMSGGLIMLNPNPETRRITIGRGIFALFFGVMVPQVVGIFHPSLETLSLKPAVLVLMGGGISAVVYVLSKPFTRELYSRAEGVAKREAEKLERKLSGEVPPAG